MGLPGDDGRAAEAVAAVDGAADAAALVVLGSGSSMDTNDPCNPATRAYGATKLAYAAFSAADCDDAAMATYTHAGVATACLNSQLSAIMIQQGEGVTVVRARARRPWRRALPARPRGRTCVRRTPSSCWLTACSANAGRAERQRRDGHRSTPVDGAVLRPLVRRRRQQVARVCADRPGRCRAACGVPPSVTRPSFTTPG